MSSLFETTYNPDVLSCIANLSNDEVFTPPELANQMLDLLPSEIWSDPDATFLDPACKSGVFLREIAKRLIEGLEGEYPDLQERLDHIYKKQIFGIAITELTSLLSRRSLYCSKYPNSKYSVVRFNGPEGNVRFRKCEHAWQNGRCKYCGASRAELDRGDEYETYQTDTFAKSWTMQTPRTASPKTVSRAAFATSYGTEIILGLASSPISRKASQILWYGILTSGQFWSDTTMPLMSFARFNPLVSPLSIS